MVVPKRKDRIKKEKKLKHRIIRRYSIVMILLISITFIGSLTLIGILFNRSNPKIVENAKVSETNIINNSQKKVIITQKNLRAFLEYRQNKSKNKDYSWDFVDRDYGPVIGSISIPKVDIKNLTIVRGVGVSNEQNTEGDFQRLYNAATWRKDEQLGGDNFVLVAHARPPEMPYGPSLTSGGFAKLLTPKNGKVATNDLNNLKIAKDDPIEVNEGTSFKYTFKITKITGTKSLAESAKLLGPYPGKPMLTLQCCLDYKNQRKLYVTAELTKITQNDISLNVKK